jgi:hypothetical protein
MWRFAVVEGSIRPSQEVPLAKPTCVLLREMRKLLLSGELLTNVRALVLS